METWQLCPKCKGNKKHFVTLLQEQDCNICDGTGIISVLNGLPPNKLLPVFPFTPNQVITLPMGNWEITCNTCNNKKQITGVKEDGLTFGHICPDCK